MFFPCAVAGPLLLSTRHIGHGHASCKQRTEQRSNSFHLVALPDSEFTGLTGTPRYEVNLLLSEGAEVKLRRFERMEGFIVSLDINRAAGGTCYVTGQALACAAGPSEERVFIERSLASV